MATLSIRKLDNQVYEQLRIRAAMHGVSMEEEVRRIISHVVAAPEHLGDIFQKYFGERNGVKIELPSRNKPHEPMRFDE
ncbi:plasmid stability protein [soil metagenome]